MDRRNFIRSLLATAVASSLPKLQVEKQTALIDRIMRAIKIKHSPGAKVLSAYFTPMRMSDDELVALTSVDPKLEATVEDVGSGMYRVRIKSVVPGADGIRLSVASGDPDGLFVGDMAHIANYLSEHPDRIACNRLTFGRGVDLDFVVKS